MCLSTVACTTKLQEPNTVCRLVAAREELNSTYMLNSCFGIMLLKGTNFSSSQNMAESWNESSLSILEGVNSTVLPPLSFPKVQIQIRMEVVKGPSPLLTVLSKSGNASSLLGPQEVSRDETRYCRRVMTPTVNSSLQSWAASHSVFLSSAEGIWAAKYTALSPGTKPHCKGLPEGLFFAVSRREDAGMECLARRVIT